MNKLKGGELLNDSSLQGIGKLGAFSTKRRGRGPKSSGAIRK